MMIVLVTNEKGGVGKTTLAVNLAAMAALAGKETVLIDTDRQQSAKSWAELRREGGARPSVLCLEKTGKCGHDIADLKGKFEIIVVDAGGRDSVEMRQSLTVCDFALIPLRPAQFDLWSLDRMASLIADIEERTGSRVNARSVINGASPNPAVKESAEIRTAMQDYDDAFPLLQTVVTERIAYRKAARDGLSIAELAPGLADPKATAELSALFKEIFQ